MTEITFKELYRGTAKLLPKWKDIPKEFRCRKTKWNVLYRIWRRFGIVNYDLEMKPGVKFNDAVKIIAAHMSCTRSDIGEFRKECGTAYMMSKFFESYTFVNRVGQKLIRQRRKKK